MTPPDDGAGSETKARLVANDLARWIDATPLLPGDIGPVYAAHVLLCSYVEQEPILREENARLREALEKASEWVGIAPISDRQIEKLLAVELTVAAALSSSQVTTKNEE